MSYKTYITDALVCGSASSNTSDKSFLLFTREAGMLYASAKSVREERSKQRYALQECSLARVTLVRGKSGWKLTGAEAEKNFYACAQTREERACVRDIFRFVRRLVHGEGESHALFGEVVRALQTVQEGEESPHALIFSLRALSLLGYLAPTDELSHVLDGGSPYTSLYPIVKEHKTLFQATVDRALTESHL